MEKNLKDFKASKLDLARQIVLAVTVASYTNPTLLESAMRGDALHDDAWQNL